MSSGDGQLAFSTASFITSMKAFQRSAFLYRSRELAARRPRLRRRGDDLLPGVDALVDRLLLGFVAPPSLCRSSSEGKSSGSAVAARSRGLVVLLPLPVALALALLGLVIHCAPPDSDPCRLSPCSRRRLSPRNRRENRRIFIARRAAAKNRKATGETGVCARSAVAFDASVMVARC